MFGVQIDIPLSISQKIYAYHKRSVNLRPLTSNARLVWEIMPMRNNQTPGNLFGLCDKMRTRFSRKRIMECLADAGGADLQYAYAQHELRQLVKTPITTMHPHEYAELEHNTPKQRRTRKA